jgi:DNA-binding transcriptional LysR family regulator
VGDTRGVELRQLAYFVAVAEEGGFTRGAQREHVVQSTMSAAVGRLEHELGQALFRRIGHRIELTDAGAPLLERARPLLAASDDIVEQLHSLDGMVHGTVTLGTVLSTGTFDLPAALISLRKNHAGIAVRVHFSAPDLDRHLERVLDGTFDLALVPEPKIRVPGVDVNPVGRVDLLLTAALDASLPDQPVGLADLAAVPFIDFPSGWPNRISTDELFAQSGVERDVAIEVADIATALDLVRGGLGVAFLPRRLVEGRTDVRVVALDAPKLTRVLVLARPSTPQRSAVETVHGHRATHETRCGRA